MSARCILLSLLLSVLVLPTVLTAQEKRIEAKPDDKKALVPALQQGGLVVYFRHAESDQSQTDAERIDFRDCKTQRNLTEKGREQSRAVGKAFAAMRIKIAKVITSPYCRAVEMGRLAFGRVTIDDDLAFAIRKPEAETQRLADHLRKLLATQPPKGTNTVLIAHTANLKEAARIWPKTEGIAHIFQPDADGRFLHVGYVLPEEWAELARVK